MVVIGFITEVGAYRTVHSEDQAIGMDYVQRMRDSACHNNVDGKDSQASSQSVGKLATKWIGWKASNRAGRIRANLTLLPETLHRKGSKRASGRSPTSIFQLSYSYSCLRPSS